MDKLLKLALWKKKNSQFSELKIDVWQPTRTELFARYCHACAL